MKTNQNLVRKMGKFNVIQRTQDGMFNATMLIKQWNSQSTAERKMDNYFNSDKTQEFINTIIERENLNTPKMVYLKSRGISGGTWMNPILFIDFAMWINPSFKYDAIKFVYDELIKYRNEAGDAYREMSESIAKLSKKGETAQNISKVAEAINHIACGQHAKMIRNQADEVQMKEYVRIEKEISMLVKKGFIKNFNDLMSFLRDEWRLKYQPSILA